MCCEAVTLPPQSIVHCIVTSITPLCYTMLLCNKQLAVNNCVTQPSIYAIVTESRLPTTEARSWLVRSLIRGVTRRAVGMVTTNRPVSFWCAYQVPRPSRSRSTVFLMPRSRSFNFRTRSTPHRGITGMSRGDLLMAPKTSWP